MSGEAQPRWLRRAGPWIVSLAVLLFLALNLTTLKPGHPPGGDFAHYIIIAQNILAGRSYNTGVFMPGVQAQSYPPGFPLLIAPVLQTAGPNLVWLKLPVVLLWPLTAWLLALIARRRLGGENALWVFLFMLFAPWFFVFKQNVLSDVPFTLLVIGAIWAFLNYADGRRAGWLALALAFTAASLLVRTAGVALVGAAVLYLALRRRAWAAALLTALVGAATLLIIKLWAASASEYLSLFHDPVFWALRLARMLPAKLAKVLGFFFPLFRGGQWVLAGVEAAAGLGLICLAAWGWLKRGLPWREWGLVCAFVVLYMVMILLWPFNEGPRFYAPVAGLLVIYLAQGLLAFFGQNSRLRRFLPQTLLRTVLLAGLALNLGNTALLWSYSGDVVERPPDKALYAWVQHNLGPQDHYLYAYPRVLALFSDRIGDKYYWNDSLAANQARMDRPGLNWLILRRLEDQAAIAAAGRDPRLRPVWSNEIYSVFRLQPSAPAGPGR
ncbi:MAG: glycosyltransferase family 39 protein [Thermodesulfobacteriota bacterium]